jgi:phenylalanyl-tRNA synthetase alpha chain
METPEDQTAPKGHIHPISQVIEDAVRIFAKMGFEIAQGPEIENEHYNFDALNIPKDHPARDMWDTFWLKPESMKKLMRTHTSPVQIRFAESHEPPFRIIAPGKTFRHEATDATHEAQFFQLEGLVIDKSISLAHLKGTLETFFKEFFEREVKVRLRPSYFPFVEPGVEVDMTCFKCGGSGKLPSKDGCNVCKHTGWIEIMGAGLVHPVVMSNVGLHRDEWSGFAFGMGIDRLASLKYGVPDVRMFYTGDLRVIDQF